MAGVSADIKTVQSGITICENSIRELERTAETLKSKYAEAGREFRDDKYRQLGNIVNECCSAVKSPEKEMTKCLEKLRALLKQVEAYENSSI